TVYEAEITGTILTLDIAHKVPRLCVVTILLENQAAIKSLHHPRKSPGQYLCLLFHRQLQTLLKKKPHLHIHMAWVPGHSKAKGNERADTSAK
ncbi:hypothetical protein K439DRAFT_1276355, partial [Ramaria rubella]